MGPRPAAAAGGGRAAGARPEAGRTAPDRLPVVPSDPRRRTARRWMSSTPPRRNLRLGLMLRRSGRPGAADPRVAAALRRCRRRPGPGSCSGRRSGWVSACWWRSPWRWSPAGRPRASRGCRVRAPPGRHPDPGPPGRARARPGGAEAAPLGPRRARGRVAARRGRPAPARLRPRSRHRRCPPSRATRGSRPTDIPGPSSVCATRRHGSEPRACGACARRPRPAPKSSPGGGFRGKIAD